MQVTCFLNGVGVSFGWEFKNVLRCPQSTPANIWLLPPQ